MKGKTCIITGATSGIGRATAFQLGALGTNLVLIGRSEVRGRKTESQIRRRSPSSKIQFIRCELAVRNEVREIARDIRARFESIDVLINNAGARFDTFGTNPDGLERTFAGNHMGHFQLTALLLGSLLNAPAARVITLGSGAHGVRPPTDWMLNEGNYDRKLAYGSSKLANIMFAYELARRLGKTQVTVNAFDPGGVATRLGLNNGLVAWLKHCVYYLKQGQLNSPRRASEGVVYLATSPEMRGKSGGYYSGHHLIRSSAISYDVEAAQALWTLSVKGSQLDAPGMGDLWKYVAP